MRICNMPCVKMDRRITLQSVTRVSDSQGGYTETWANVVDVWAQLNPKKSYERFQALQYESPATHEVIMRYRSGVTNAMRFTYNSRIFHIKEVININEANVYLKLQAIEMA